MTDEERFERLKDYMKSKGIDVGDGDKPFVIVFTDEFTQEMFEKDMYEMGYNIPNKPPKEPQITIVYDQQIKPK